MPLTIHHPEVRRDGLDTCVLVRISDHDPVEFRLRGDTEIEFDPVQLGNLSLTLALQPAMRLGAELVIEAPVSAELLHQADTLQQIFHRWFRDPMFHRIEIRAEPATSPASPQADGCACFFSGGVDSLHSVQLHRDELSQLIFVHGFDIPPGEIGQAELVRQHLQSAAGEIGLPVTEIWTDLRSFSEPHCWWDHYFGTALAAVAHLLSPNLRRVFIPGSCAYEILLPWGSHPLTDPLWGTGGLEIVHDGAGFTRMEKTADLASWGVAQKYLRVCWEGPPGSYNCGGCEKCVRTQAALRACGQLENFPVFDAPLDLERLAAQRAPNPAVLPMVEDTLAYAREQNTDPELVDALDRSARGTQAELTVKHFARNNRDAIATDNWQRILPKIRNKLFRSISESDPDWFVGRLEKLLPEHRDAILKLLHKSDRKGLARAIRALRRKKKN